MTTRDPVHQLQQCIGGEWLPSTGTQTFAVTNPSTGQILHPSVPIGTAEDAQRAIEACKAAQPIWAKKSAPERAKCLSAMARVIREHAEELAVSLSKEQNKQIDLAKAEVGYAADYFDYYAGLARVYHGDIINSDSAYENIYIHKFALGISVGIIAWNFPIFVMARKLAPALLAGCAVIVKSSEVTPLTPALLVKYWLLENDPDIPKGVFSLLSGLGTTVGQALVSSPQVDIISMTGSLSTGKKIMRAASENMTKVSLELGGKAPAIVCADADIALAVSSIVQSRTAYTGQICNSCERVYVQEEIAEAFTYMLVEAMKGVRIGDPNDECDCCGLVSLAQLEKVEAMVNRAVADGAKVLCGGHVIPGPGFKYACTVLVNVKQGSEIVQEEIFGPVLPVLTFSSLDEAFDLANDSKYGLTSSLFTTSADIVERSKRELLFGETYVNRESFEAIQGFHAGARSSGIGGADGRLGLEEYLATHVVYQRYNESAGN